MNLQKIVQLYRSLNPVSIQNRGQAQDESKFMRFQEFIGDLNLRHKEAFNSMDEDQLKILICAYNEGYDSCRFYKLVKITSDTYCDNYEKDNYPV